MSYKYSNEQNILILLALMKKHNIRKVVASPGATNVCFVTSIQNDPYFEVYSSVDERSAAYIACGLAEESGEPVALSCTGATASRNYVSALTEAYYRKLPIVAITSTQPEGRIGHNVPQVIDRTNLFNDIAKISVQIPVIHSDEDRWACSVKMNKALSELRHNGGGPVHINLTTTYSEDYSVSDLPDVQFIERLNYKSELPDLKNKKVAIFVGAHSKWTDRLLNAVDKFCEKYNAAVICDHTSNYQGKYGVLASLITGQDKYYAECRTIDVLIHIGNVSGGYIFVYPKEVWRVNPDGLLCDTFNKLRYSFEMDEDIFFESYVEASNNDSSDSEYAKEWQREYKNIFENIPELPFSNAWIAKNTINKLPKRSVLHLGILNSLRNWNLFEGKKELLCYSNTGGFGIDGCVSSLIGASLANKDKLYYGVVGDLAFFYDMNSIGNRHVQNNIRLIVVNNGEGAEFRNYNHTAGRLGEMADKFVAAKGHFGRQSRELLKHYAEDLGFEYMSASNKDEYRQVLSKFVSEEITDKPILLEVFTSVEDESNALKIINNVAGSNSSSVIGIAKGMAKKVLKH